MTIKNKNNKVLIIHNILWSHYQAVIYSVLNKICDKEKIELLIIQISLTEKSRINIGEIDYSLHKYPYKVLFQKNYDSTKWYEKFILLLKEIYSFKPQVICIPGYSDFSYILLMILCKIFLKKKIIIGIDSTEFDSIRFWYNEIYKKYIIKFADAFCSYGEASKKYLINLGIKDEKKIFSNCQAVDNNSIYKIYKQNITRKNSIKKLYDLMENNFCYVGRLSKEKNLELLINAKAELDKYENGIKNWGLIIIGEGKERKALEGLVEKLGIKTVKFLGGKSWREIVVYMSISDVFILPSISEPWGLVINEAMVCGLPIIASNKCGAVFDLIKEGKNGYIFDPYEINELKSCMLKFINKEVNILDMGLESKKNIKKFKPINAAKQIFLSIKSVL